MLRLAPTTAVFIATLATAAAADTPGLSPTKPSDGRFVETDRGFMVPYEETIPGTDVTFSMTPVPGGVVTLGPRAQGDGPDAEEFPTSPVVRVRVPPFWIATHEVTWAEYQRYMQLDRTFGELTQLQSMLMTRSGDVTPALDGAPHLNQAVRAEGDLVDGVTAPTALYDPTTTYESGEDPELPAVTMTVYAARQYTKWLSVLTERDYRLPSEAEWEHAARAGEEGDYIGGAADGLSEYAWYMENGDLMSHVVGQKKPNAWGLYDVIGNAAEWVLDAPTDEPAGADGEPISWRAAIAPPEKQYPRIAKGGYWDAPAEACRYASRMLSEDEYWKASDPNIPTSPWWYSDYPAGGVGMRIVRPLEPMDDETKQLAWEIDTETLRQAVTDRLREGRGKLRRVDSDLPKALEELESRDIRKLLE